MTERDHEARRAALTLLARGEMTLAEAARFAGVSRQLARYWAEAGAVDWRRMREAKLTDMWRKELKGALKPKTKA